MRGSKAKNRSNSIRIFHLISLFFSRTNWDFQGKVLVELLFVQPLWNLIHICVDLNCEDKVVSSLLSMMPNTNAELQMDFESHCYFYFYIFIFNFSLGCNSFVMCLLFFVYYLYVFIIIIMHSFLSISFSFSTRK